MGINYTCDCCLKPSEKVTEVGYVGKAYYCDDCLPKYQDYHNEIDDYHTVMTGIVALELKAIKHRWLMAHKGARLPE